MKSVTSHVTTSFKRSTAVIIVTPHRIPDGWLSPSTADNANPPEVPAWVRAV
jgi:hypothetical protein